MKRISLYLALLFLLLFSSLATYSQQDVVLENKNIRLTIGANAIAKSLVYKPTNEECIVVRDSTPVFSVTQERPYHNEIKLAHPNKRMTFKANSVRREGDSLIVGFELVPYDAIIAIRETEHYIGFTFVDFEVHPNVYPNYLKMTPPPASEISFLQLPVRNRERFGEWLNVSWDDKVAVNVLGTDPFARIDAKERNGYRIMHADGVKDVKLRNVGAALIVCESNQLLDYIARVEEDFDLPRGVESRRNQQTKLSYYWSSNVNKHNIDEHLRYAVSGGFRNFMIYYPAFLISNGYRKLGDYEIDKDLYPNGLKDLEELLKKIEKAGLTPGLHILHSHIGRDSKYVTPIPDHRLNLLRHFTLARPMGEKDSVIYVSQNPEGATMAEGTRVLKIGTELISYEDFTVEKPYKFFGCKRGIDNTTINEQPMGYIFGLLDVSEFGATSVYIDQNTDLQDEIADKVAKIYDTGFKALYFDGSEGVNNPFWFHVASAQHKIFSRLGSQPLFAEGAAKTHFSWHMLSGGNAFDVFPPETLKEEVKRWPAEEAPRMEDDFTRINFGWLGYVVPSKETVGTQPDMLEYVTSRAAAWDCPVSIQTNLERFKNHPRTADNMEVFRRWEEVRITNWLTDKQKDMLQDLEQEHILLIDEKGEFELQPYNQIERVANGDSSIRAFVFEREEVPHVVYWHTNGNGKLKLKAEASKVHLYEEIGVEKPFLSTKDKTIVIPASDRQYLKTTHYTREELAKLFEEAEVVD